MTAPIPPFWVVVTPFGTATIGEWRRAKKRLQCPRSSGIVRDESGDADPTGEGRKGMAGRTKGAVGVIGLGIMGGAYATNLTAAGWRVVGFDTNPTRCKEATRTGVAIRENAKAVAREVASIITSLPTPYALEMTVEGIVAAGAPRRI